MKITIENENSVDRMMIISAFSFRYAVAQMNFYLEDFAIDMTFRLPKVIIKKGLNKCLKENKIFEVKELEWKGYTINNWALGHLEI